SVILAITLYPLQVRLRGRVFAGDGRTATLIIVLVIAIVLMPTYLLGTALIESMEQAMAIARRGEFHIPPPPEALAGWPQVGRRLHDAWAMAATDAASLMERLGPQIKAASLTVLGAIGGVGAGGRASQQGCGGQAMEGG
ncbi:UNVERIFIED_CONTAM: hypothetical protein OHV15_17065, partial [Microbacterium sp. SLM126]